MKESQSLVWEKWSSQDTHLWWVIQKILRISQAQGTSLRSEGLTPHTGHLGTGARKMSPWLMWKPVRLTGGLLKTNSALEEQGDRLSRSQSQGRRRLKISSCSGWPAKNTAICPRVCTRCALAPPDPVLLPIKIETPSSTLGRSWANSDLWLQPLQPQPQHQSRQRLWLSQCKPWNCGSSPKCNHILDQSRDYKSTRKKQR